MTCDRLDSFMDECGVGPKPYSGDGINYREWNVRAARAGKCQFMRRCSRRDQCPMGTQIQESNGVNPAFFKPQPFYISLYADDNTFSTIGLMNSTNK